MPDEQFPGDLLLDNMRGALARIQSANQSKWAGIGQMAGPAAVMALQLDMVNVRIFTLARMIFGDDSHALTRFQIEFEKLVSDSLDEAAGEVRKAQMAAAAQAPPEAVRQMAKASGLLGPDGRPLG